MSLLAARGCNKNSCTVLHVCGIQLKSATAWQGRLLSRPPAANRKRTAGIVAVQPIPVFLDSKEEIGWKVPLQNGNLWQEIV